MRIMSFSSKIISIIGFFILLFTINFSFPFKHREVPAKQKFVVSSLDSAGKHKVTLTITIAPNNDVRVVRKVAIAGPKDVHAVYILGDSLHSIASSADTAEFEIISKRQGSQRFWLNFDQLTFKLVSDGGDSFKFFCISENCIKNMISLPVLTTTGYLTSFSCIQSCQVCVLEHFITPGFIVEGGGVYIYANSVTYQ